MTSSPSPFRKKPSIDSVGLHTETSMSPFHMSSRRPVTGSPPASTGTVSASRWTWVSGTHSSRTIERNSPTASRRQGDWR